MRALFEAISSGLGALGLCLIAGVVALIVIMAIGPAAADASVRERKARRVRWWERRR